MYSLEFPVTAITFGWDYGGQEIQIEKLNQDLHLHYTSLSTSEEEDVILDLNKRKVKKEAKRPKDFYPFICTLINELNRGYQEYSKTWKNNDYNEVLSVLKIIKIDLEARSKKKNYFNFNPRNLLSSILEENTNPQNTTYNAYLEPLLPTIHGEKYYVERELSLVLLNDRNVRVKFSYKFNGQEFQTLESILPNDEDIMRAKLTKYDKSTLEKRIIINFIPDEEVKEEA